MVDFGCDLANRETNEKAFFSWAVTLISWSCPLWGIDATREFIGSDNALQGGETAKIKLTVYSYAVTLIYTSGSSEYHPGGIL